MGKPPEIPDLDLPTGAPSRRPAPQSSARPQAPVGGDDFGDGIERGGGHSPVSAPPGGPRGKAISVDFGVRGDDDFGDELERGAGASMAPTSSSSGRPISSRAPASMNLDVAYRRPGASAPQSFEPSSLEELGGRALAAVGLAAAIAPLMIYVHHTGAFSITKLLPHALDASSLTQSGAMGGGLLIASIAVGFLGLKVRRRSYAMVFSAALFLISALAMVTVALVATDENPQNPDGARLIPYLLPTAFMLLGLGVSARGHERFFDGGAKRILPFAFGLLGGVLVYAGIALSAF